MLGGSATESSPLSAERALTGGPCGIGAVAKVHRHPHLDPPVKGDLPACQVSRLFEPHWPLTKTPLLNQAPPSKPVPCMGLVRPRLAPPLEFPPCPSPLSGAPPPVQLLQRPRRPPPRQPGPAPARPGAARSLVQRRAARVLKESGLLARGRPRTASLVTSRGKPGRSYLGTERVL